MVRQPVRWTRELRVTRNPSSTSGPRADLLDGLAIAVGVLLSGQLADPLSGLLARQDPHVPEPAPLADQRRVQPVLAQIRTALAVGDGRLVRGQVVKLLRGGERPPRGRAPERGPGLLLGPSSRTAIKDELMLLNSKIHAPRWRTCYEPPASTHPDP